MSSEASSALSSKEKTVVLIELVFALTGPLLKLSVTGLSVRGSVEGADGPGLT